MRDALREAKEALQSEVVPPNYMSDIAQEMEDLLKEDIDFSQIAYYEDYMQTIAALKQKENKIAKKRNSIYLRRQRRNTFFSVLGVLLVLGGVVFGIRGIAKKIASRPKPEFVIGGKGQGGVVFYDKGEYTDGWRYLECSLTYLSETYFCKDRQMLVGLKTELGEGDFNTDAILFYKGEDTAAGKARAYNGGGYDDWYLPNRAEAREMYDGLVKNRKGKRRAKKVAGYENVRRGFFVETNMWTSEMVNEDEAYYMSTDSYTRAFHTEHVYDFKGPLFNMTLISHRFLRPIRKF